MNSSGFNLARIIGPSLAAIIIDRFGLAWCFAVNALSYLLVLLSLFRIKLQEKVIEETELSPTEGLMEGIRFMRKSREVSLLMSMVTVYSIFGIPYLVLMPVIARDTLHGTARTYGLLLASVGLGAVTGAFALAMVGRRVRRGKVLAAAAFSFSTLLIAFSFSRSIWLSAAILFFTGMTMILNNALANGLLQTITPDNLRGRVMSAYAFVFVGMAPIGSLLSGSVASALGAPAAIGIGAGVLLLLRGVGVRNAEGAEGAVAGRLGREREKGGRGGLRAVRAVRGVRRRARPRRTLPRHRGEDRTPRVWSRPAAKRVTSGVGLSVVEAC